MQNFFSSIKLNSVLKFFSLLLFVVLISGCSFFNKEDVPSQQDKITAPTGDDEEVKEEGIIREHTAVGTITNLTDESLRASSQKTREECEANGGYLKFTVAKNEIWLDYNSENDTVTGKGEVVVHHEQDCNGKIDGNNIFWFELIGSYSKGEYKGTVTAGGQRAQVQANDGSDQQESITLPLQTTTWVAKQAGIKIGGVIGPNSSTPYRFEVWEKE